ncbi:MAG: NADH:flavin oxidoreductase [Gammaproteobacteria bacterium (ex Lamellibrachia satsuma)]|nr:MAG: alkene reductase [Gammaproteobacteria bacterium (ex Lamellibrachia satsuma)]RRS31029.1 MAG: NADH:flavin oxidoreductase [Gammaproteobacteria bacterium (ex Lamellibrachia satsuma)]RRS34731.1 MAG: NADH:flavin oxidoreductase [Gammaproteobacteria bacterium (ex Lamellibrachia satsuma)]
MNNIDLFTPLTLGGLTLPNRIVMAPMTRNRAGEGNVPTALNAKYYSQRAAAGLIITEASQISPEAVGYPATPGIHSDEQVAGWRQVTDAVHAEDGRIFLQLWHVGRISHSSMLPDNIQPVAPSAIRPEGDAVTYEGMQPFETPRVLTIEEIPGLCADYAAAAQRARDAGFDGVEIHAANGYLLDEFIRDGTNTRTDTYGGSIENRMRLLDEVITAVSKVWPSNRIGVRLSPENQFNDIRDSQPQATFNAVVDMLRGHQLAYLHVLEGDMLGGDRLVDYHELKRRFGGLYTANNGYTQARAEQALQQGDADLVAFGKLFIANPDLPERFAQGARLNEPNPETFYGGDEKGYTDYPFL